MKKLLLIIMLIATMLLTFGCGSNEATNATENNATENNATEDNTAVDPGLEDILEELDLDYSAGLDEKGHFENVTAGDFVEIKDYLNIVIPADVHEISDVTRDANVTDLLKDFVTTDKVMDRAIVDGDTVNIDYVGSIDGVEFQGGSTGGAGTDVTIGVTNYIEGFLSQLIGHTPGETFDIDVTFPDDYGSEDLKGKDAVFAITVNHIAISITPELTDAFVSENFSESLEVETVSALNDLVKEQLHTNAVRNFVQNFIISNAVIETIPEEVTTFQTSALTNYYTMSANSYNMTVDEFLAAYIGYPNVDALLEGSQDQITAISKFTLTIQAIAEESEIEVTDADLKAYFTEISDKEDYSEFETIYGLPYLKNSVLQEIVLTFLVDNAELAK